MGETISSTLSVEDILFEMPVISEAKETAQQASALSKAVAALSLKGGASRSPKALNLSVNCSSNETELPDSGYASQISTAESSKATSIDNDSVVKQTGLWPAIRRKKMKLRAFDINIPQLTKDRFEDLRELYADDINKLTRGLPRCSGILMTLKVLGESESEAGPWVFIQCDKAVVKKLRSFFKRPNVKADFQPPNSTTYSPHFEIYVCELPPKLLTKVETSDLMKSVAEIEVDRQIMQSNTLCGMAIRTVVDGETHLATIGGLIEVVKDEEHSKVFAMTAGHFLMNQKEGLEESLESSLSFDDMSDDDEDCHSLDEDSFELDLEALPSNVYASAPTLQSGTKDISTDVKALNTEWSNLGVVYKSSFDLAAYGNNLDWALVEVNNGYRHLPNMILKDEVKRAHPASGFGRDVKLLTGVSGFQSGSLSNSWACLSLASGKTMTKTYVLKLCNNKVLQNGDSGAWVVDAESNEVYGHVVASDVFGSVYVVPLENTFLEIKRQLLASLVAIPLSSKTMQGRKQPDLPNHPPCITKTAEKTTHIAMPSSEENSQGDEFQDFPMDNSDRYDAILPEVNNFCPDLKFFGTKPSKAGYDSGYNSGNSSRESSMPDAAARPSLLELSIKDMWKRSKRDEGSPPSIMDIRPKQKVAKLEAERVQKEIWNRAVRQKGSKLGIESTINIAEEIPTNIKDSFNPLGFCGMTVDCMQNSYIARELAGEDIQHSLKVDAVTGFWLPTGISETEPRSESERIRLQQSRIEEHINRIERYKLRRWGQGPVMEAEYQ